MGPRSLQRYVELRVDAVSALALVTLNREHGLQTYAYLVVSGSWTCDVYRKSTECRRKAGLVVRVVFFDQTTQRTSKHAMQPTLSANACTTRAEPPRCGKRRKGAQMASKHSFRQHGAAPRRKHLRGAFELIILWTAGTSIMHACANVMLVTRCRFSVFMWFHLCPSGNVGLYTCRYPRVGVSMACW